MRVLHIVKTSDGARWAALQAQVLASLGIEVHVAVPSIDGEAIELWRQAKASIHVLDCSLPLKMPHKYYARVKALRTLVEQVDPDLIHSHFVTTTMFLRSVLGRDHRIPRLFQVPGPLHMEHKLYRQAEISTAGESDYWIASSHYTRRLYLGNSVPEDRVFLSYYGTEFNSPGNDVTLGIREHLSLEKNGRLIGNINYMYPPKYYLGQVKGLKRHEDVIDAVGIIARKHTDVFGVLVGGQWGKGRAYEQRLHRRASRVARGRILFTGKVKYENAAHLWHGFDLAVHVPISENSGGVIEPLQAGVPIVASSVGGLPEVVLDGLTGWIVPPSDPKRLAETAVNALSNQDEAQRRTLKGQQLVAHMFDVLRTGSEVAEIYEAVLKSSRTMPEVFNSKKYVENL